MDEYQRAVKYWREWYSRNEARIEPRQRWPFRRLLKGSLWNVSTTHDRRGTLVTLWLYKRQRAFCIVKDSTNQKRIHILAVPPDTHTCTAGLAWMAGMTEQQYELLKIES